MRPPAAGQVGRMERSIDTDVVEQVARCLYEHPHDTTVDAVALRLVTVDPAAVRAALTALCERNLALTSGEHFQLSGRGYRTLDRAA
jgi:hypothetical protein